MKTNLSRSVLLIAFALQVAPPGANAQTGAAAADAKSEEAELVKKTLNPVSSLMSVPIQNNWDFGIGQSDAMRYTANIQPVIPLSLNKDWNLISRTIVPVIYQESLGVFPVAPGVFRRDPDHWGLGDISQSLFLSPKGPVGGWILGGGPVLLFPTATDSVLGAGKWGAGPTAVVLRQDNGFTYGALVNHIWSYAGWGNREVSATFLQPFFGYSTKTFTTFLLNTESTYDWQAKQWSVPINFQITQLLKVGKQPISLQLGYRYYAEGPSGGPDWGIRFAVTLLFPK